MLEMEAKVERSDRINSILKGKRVLLQISRVSGSVSIATFWRSLIPDDRGYD